MAFDNIKNIDQNFDSVSELYLDENFLTGLHFLQKFPRLKILHASNFLIIEGHNWVKDMGSLKELSNLK